MKREKILLADDNPVNLQVLTDALEPAGYEILAAPNGETALDLAKRAKPDLLLLDIMMPRIDGLEVCRRLKADAVTSGIPVIFVTAKNNPEMISEAFDAGAVDYVTKPFHPAEVLARIGTHCRARRLTRELEERNRELTETNARLREEVGRREKAEDALESADRRIGMLVEREAAQIEGFVGNSGSITHLLEDVRKLHAFGATGVLLTGESGTGKELIARAIHFGGARAQQAFVPVNCVAIPGELAESVFFGHIKGSFTGATSDRKGYFELADGGTLFLDEIGDMPMVLQAKLLRVLEDQVVTPVGGAQGRKVDVRVIAATNADLDDKIAAGSFRRDLYFRLARFTVAIPPLRERRQDVPLLAQHFLEMFAKEMGRKAAKLSAAAEAALCGHSFPGNVRELRNIIERALIESEGREIGVAHLHLSRGSATAVTARKGEETAHPVTSVDGGMPLNLDEAEDLLIQRALAQTGGNIAEAARLLGIHRTRIYRKLAGKDAGTTGG